MVTQRALADRLAIGLLQSFDIRAFAGAVRKTSRDCYFRYLDFYRSCSNMAILRIVATASWSPSRRAEIATIDIDWALASASCGGRLTRQSLLAAIDDLILTKRAVAARTTAATESGATELVTSAI
jgi:hypothetical protein